MQSAQFTAGDLAALAFWASAGLLAYTFVLYPALITFLASRRPRNTRSDRSFEPAVTVVIAAHNESGRIAAKIANVLELDYPPGQIDVVIGSDGSTDGTAAKVRESGDARVRVVEFEQRSGKPAVLNALVPAATGQIVLLADVRQRFDRQLLRAIVAPFADPAVGAVSGELMLTGDEETTAAGQGTGAYWRYEKLIRSAESRFHSTVGATGAVYAIRKELFETIPDDTLLDDVLIPLNIARRGYRVVFESGARAYDRPADSTSEEFTRKVRTIAGNFQLFARHRWTLGPASNPLWWQSISHKVMRLLTPALQVIALGSNAVLGANAFYRATLMVQVVFYAAAATGFLLRRRRLAPFLSVPYTFCVLSAATVGGFIRFVTGKQPVTWTKAVSRARG